MRQIEAACTQEITSAATLPPLEHATIQSTASTLVLPVTIEYAVLNELLRGMVLRRGLRAQDL